MGKKKAKNEKKSELKVIFFIILIAAALFIISTYAWFSTQRNVSITNLKGTVEVAEGLEISLDANTWSNGIVLGDGEGQLSIIDDAYEGHSNLSPTEMLPVSTLGKVTESNKLTYLQMLRGKVENSIILKDIVEVSTNDTIKDPENAKFAGYFAFDVFLKNSSKTDDADILQLNYDSSVQITESEKVKTGLQNTVRVGFAKFGGASADSGGTLTGIVTDVNAGQDEILKKTGAITGGDTVYISDVAIWEPNASDHAEYIVTNNNKITWSSTDSAKYNTYEYDDDKYGFGTTTKMPTYALKASAIGGTIENLYKWDGNESLLQEQIVLQTTKTSDEDYTISEGVQNLVSANSAASTGDNANTFTIPANSICRLKIYLWLEGQDVDCINYASHGGGVTVNIGLVKKSEIGSHEPTEATT